MKIAINIKNNLKANQEIVLLDSMFNSKGTLPKGITSTVDIVEGENINTVDYSQLVEQLNHITYEVKIQSTSNNRQIDFYRRTKETLEGYKYDGKPYFPMSPYLTKEGKPRKSKYSIKSDCYVFYPKWNPKEWNIADTHELFILDNKILFELQIKGKQKFIINIDVTPKLDFSKINTELMPKISKNI